MARIILVILILMINTVAYADVITCNTMVGDGSTDNTSYFNACTAAAASESEKSVIIPNAANYYSFGADAWAADVIIPANVSVTGETGATFAGTVELSDYSKIINIIFKSRSRSVTTAANSLVTGGWIQDCTFEPASWSTILLYYTDDFVVDNNIINNTGNTSSNIQILGGQGNIITNNSISGGITCIIFKYYDGGDVYDGNGGGPGTAFHDNIIMGNTCHGFTEEGISFDVEGSATYTMAFKEYDTIASVGSSQVTLNSGGWGGGDDPNYVGYDMVFLDGALIGETREITVQSNAVFTLDSSITGASAGDKIIIAATYKRNKIAYNHVYDSGFPDAAILLYGLNFQNYVFENDLDDGSVSIRSIDDFRRPDTLGTGLGNVTNTGGRAPCGYNYIHDNNMAITHYCFYFSWAYGSGYSLFYTYGNAIVNNYIPSGVNFQYTSYYESGTTPSWYGTEVSTTRLSQGDVADRIDFSTPTCENQGLGCFTSYTIGHVEELDASCGAGNYCAAFGVRKDIVPPDPPSNLRIWGSF